MDFQGVLDFNMDIDKLVTATARGRVQRRSIALAQASARYCGAKKTINEKIVKTLPKKQVTFK